MSRFVPLSQGTTHRDKMPTFANTGFSVACPGFVPACPGLVPSLSGTCKPLRNGQLPLFPQAVPAFSKTMRHIVPQAVSQVNFSKRVKVQMRVHVSVPHGDCCTYRSGVQCRYAGSAGNACFSKVPRLHALRGTLPAPTTPSSKTRPPLLGQEGSSCFRPCGLP